MQTTKIQTGVNALFFLLLKVRVILPVSWLLFSLLAAFPLQAASSSSSQRIQVQEFSLTGAEDLPDFGVSIAEIHSTILSPAQSSQGSGGMSFKELESVSASVMDYYRARGLVFASVSLPAQTIRTGVVELVVRLGHLGRVRVEGNVNYSASLLRAPFSHLIGQPLTPALVESTLLRVTDFPGLRAFGVFEPGQSPGEVDLVVKVQAEKAYDGVVSLDNHGSKSTGRNRGQMTLSWNNPTGGADRLTVGYLRSWNPANSNYWSLDYTHYLGWGVTGGLSLFRNGFEVDNSLELHGETKQRSVYLTKSIIRSRRENLSGRISLTQKTSNTDTFFGRSSTDRLGVLGITLNYDIVDGFNPLRLMWSPLGYFKGLSPVVAVGGGLNSMSVAYRRGFNDFLGALGSSESQASGSSHASRRGWEGYAEGEFNKLLFSYQRLQFLTRDTSLLLRTDFQWSDDVLMPLEQYSVGGSGNVRGYSQAQGLFDKAAFLSLEYSVRGPFLSGRPAFLGRTWDQLLSWSVFYDVALGKQNEALDVYGRKKSSSWNNFKSIGTGLTLNLPGGVEAVISYARELDGRSPSDERYGGHFWGGLSWRF